MRRHWEKAFLAALENTGSVSAAAEAAQMGRSMVYAHKRSDPEFARQWEEALETSADLLADEARRRAFSGSDVLLIFLLKALCPQKFRESRATIAPSELNRMIETELRRLAAAKKDDEAELSGAVN